MNKIEENEKKTKRKAISLALSIIIHGALIYAIFSLTLELTMPVGNVSGTLEFNAVAPEGSQLETLNVAPVAQPEVPEKVKQEAAPPPPPPPVRKNKTTSDDVTVKEPEPIKESLPEPVEEGTLPVEAVMPIAEPEKTEEPAEPEPEPQVPPVALPDSLPEKSALTTETEAPPQPLQSTLPPVVGPGGNTNTTATATGNDSVNLKGQERVADQNYGIPGGVKLADQYLRPIPGNKMPEYPWSARLRRIEGQVIVVFYVNSAGEVSNLRITQSTHEVFNDAVLKAMNSWKFAAPVEPGEYAKPWKFTLKGEAQDVPTRYKKK